jgi:hypothetical protein
MEVSLREAWWGHIAEDMLPLLWEEEKEGQAGSSRGHVVQHGWFLRGQRRLAHDLRRQDTWLDGLEGHVEVFDRMDGLQMLSMRGPVSFSEQDECVSMSFFSDSPQARIKTAAFSAASRDSVLRRFATMRDYFTRGHGEEYSCCLCIRVTLRDTRSGRMAVVWEGDNALFGLMEDHDDGFDCFGNKGTPREIPMARLVCPYVAYFGVRRVEDQGEDVSEPDRLYRIHPVSISGSDPSLDFDFKVLGGTKSDKLTLGHIRLALQAVMTPASMDGGVGAAGS